MERAACGSTHETSILTSVTTYTIRIGSRGSQLALWQANHIAAQLRGNGHTVEIEVIRTIGDRMQDSGFVAPATFEDGSPTDARQPFHPGRYPHPRRRPRPLRRRAVLGPAHAASNSTVATTSPRRQAM